MAPKSHRAFGRSTKDKALGSLACTSEVCLFSIPFLIWIWRRAKTPSENSVHVESDLKHVFTEDLSAFWAPEIIPNCSEAVRWAVFRKLPCGLLGVRCLLGPSTGSAGMVSLVPS